MKKIRRNLTLLLCLSLPLPGQIDIYVCVKVPVEAKTAKLTCPKAEEHLSTRFSCQAVQPDTLIKLCKAIILYNKYAKDYFGNGTVNNKRPPGNRRPSLLRLSIILLRSFAALRMTNHDDLWVGHVTACRRRDFRAGTYVRITS